MADSVRFPQLPEDFPVLKAGRCQLRQITPQDQQHIFQGLSDPNVTAYYGVHYETLEQTKEQMQWYKSLEEEKTGLWWAICDSNGGFLGAAGLNNLSMEHRKAELGFWLLPDHWRRGIMKEALPAILEYASTTLALHRIEAIVEVGNQSSEVILNKLGFRCEGTLRDAEIKGGKYISLRIYALILD